ncbi:hypothetical protein ACFL2Q_11990 [Thermodesulfobacteriota bacterium]
MKKRRCSACCGLYEPCLKVKNQRYCSDKACQRERKRLWQKRKRAEDAAYRANQLDANKKWRKKNPNYWRDYRKRHSDYVARNRELQLERNRRRRHTSAPIAKMDAINVKIEVIPRC